MGTFFSEYIQGHLRGSTECINTQYKIWCSQMCWQVGSDKHLFLQ